MKNKRTIITMIVLISAFVLFPAEKSESDQEIMNQIKEILSNPFKTFKLNKIQTMKNLKRIDQWFLQIGGLEKARPVKKKGKKQLIYERLVKKNSPIFSGKRKKKGLMINKPFIIRYEIEDQQRSFRKDIRLLTKNQLSKTRVVEIGRGLVLANKFIEESEHDKLAEPLVVAWKSHPLKEKIREKEKFTVLQRVIIGRNFSGREVINSKIMIDVHPDTEEILAYKHFDWSSIEDESGKILDYISLDTVLEKVNSAMKGYPGYSIQKVEQKLFQTKEHLIPVLVFEMRIKSEEPNQDDQYPVLVINLLKDISFDLEMKTIKQPDKVKK